MILDVGVTAKRDVNADPDAVDLHRGTPLEAEASTSLEVGVTTHPEAGVEIHFLDIEVISSRHRAEAGREIVGDTLTTGEAPIDTPAMAGHVLAVRSHTTKGDKRC